MIHKIISINKSRIQIGNNKDYIFGKYEKTL